MLTLAELLENRGFVFDNPDSIKLMRHVNEDQNLIRPVPDLSREHFEEFQSYQKQKRLAGKSWLLSFLQWPERCALLEGVYKVEDVLPRGTHELSAHFPCRDRTDFLEKAHGYYFYQLTRDQRFSDLERRVAIQWPDPMIKHWHIEYRATFKGCQVVEVLPEDFSTEFPGFGPLILQYGKLQTLFDNPLAYRKWKDQLSSVGGVYLITADNGNQYVGSASGKNGLWGRWGDYARNPTGGNEVLKDLLRNHPGIESTFIYSVLRTFDIGISPSEAVHMEEEFRKKLGRRAALLDVKN